MRVFFDSSALAKRYVEEQGTADVLAWCDQAGELALSLIALPELISAFSRLLREGRLNKAQYRQLKTDLMADVADALICDTTPQVVQKAIALLETQPLRGMDAIHLAAALCCSAEVFVSADARQCAAAKHFSGMQIVEIRS